MYTGIVAGAFPLAEVIEQPGLHTLVVALPSELRVDLALGASVGMDGVCLTVTRIDGDRVYFDAMQETLTRTTLGALKAGDRVNIERSAKGQVEIGGHIVSGHVDAMATITRIERPTNNYVITLQIPADYLPYVFNKGFIALNGCSLTVSELDQGTASFRVWLIPETLHRTTFGEKKVGDRINMEVERQTQVIVDTVRRFLQEQLSDRQQLERLLAPR